MLPLMIIDMQPGFLLDSRLPAVVKQCVHQARLAKRRMAPIILVEYGDNGVTNNGPTIPAISSILENYPIVHRIIKLYDDVTRNTDKWPDVVRRLVKKIRMLRVCGVNTNACVQSSVTGLHRMFPDLTIQVVRRACGNTWPWENFKWVRQYPRVNILN